ncbi:MAG: hypothetical protein MRERV_6c072 [Mycoplasmataceae bacterium RV_VA103A]|nr:MAG: hypothetical protein MRERV_6c072 [Mycoplasmataceae bacterium RV_VA103A]
MGKIKNFWISSRIKKTSVRHLDTSMNDKFNFKIFSNFPYFGEVNINGKIIRGPKPYIEIEGKNFWIIPIDKDFMSFNGGEAGVKTFAYLLVPDDNSDFANHAKKAISEGEKDANFIDDNFFSLPFECLKLKPGLLFSGKTFRGNGFFVKDTSQIKFLGNSEPPSIKLTFKVVKATKKGLNELFPEGNYRKMKEGDNYGYGYELETEPLVLGIEGIPPITRILFCLFGKNRVEGKAKMDGFKEKYEKMVAEATGKELSMEVKNWILDGDGSNYNTLHFQDDDGFGEMSISRGGNNPNEDRNNPVIIQLQTSARQTIAKLLKDNSLKTVDLDSKFANWETVLEKLNSETKIKDYQTEIRQAIQEQKDKKQKLENNSDSSLSTAKIAIGAAIILFVLVLSIGFFVVRKRKK